MRLRIFILGIAIAAGFLTAAYAVSQTHELVMAENGQVVVDANTKILRVRGGVDIDSLIWVAFDKPGFSIDEFKATLHLPKPLPSVSSVNHKLLAIHGVGETSSQFVDSQTIVYQAADIAPTATVSVVADFPKGYLNLPLSTKATDEIGRLNKVWVTLSIILPLTAVLILGFIIFLRWRDHHIALAGVSDGALPAKLPPALVSMLYSNKIEPEAIAATLIDLARRGFLTIFNKGDNFIFAKEKDIDLSSVSFQTGNHDIVLSRSERAVAIREGLEPFEKILLSKVFVSSRPIASKEDVKVRIGHGLFSKKVAAVYIYLFDLASSLGQFVPRATAVHRDYLAAGWITTIVGFIGFVFGAWTLPDPKYFLLFWAGMMLVGYTIVKIAPYVPIRGANGRAELAKFLPFREFLTLKDRIPDNWTVDQFFTYLPYAWALQAQEQFSLRFNSKSFHRPRWYFSNKDVNSAYEFVSDLIPLVSFVAESFASVREKTLV